MGHHPSATIRLGPSLQFCDRSEVHLAQLATNLSAQPTPREYTIDADLVPHLHAGDLAAFNAIYHRHRRWILNLAFRFARDHHVAVEALESVMAEIASEPQLLDPRLPLKRTLYPLIRRFAVDRQSHPRRSLALREFLTHPNAAAFTSAGDPLDIDHQHRIDNLIAAVDHLEPGQREPLILRFADELAIEDIAIALHLDLRTTSLRLSSALRTLRDHPMTSHYFQPHHGAESSLQPRAPQLASDLLAATETHLPIPASTDARIFAYARQAFERRSTLAAHARHSLPLHRVHRAWLTRRVLLLGLALLAIAPLVIWLIWRS